MSKPLVGAVVLGIVLVAGLAAWSVRSSSSAGSLAIDSKAGATAPGSPATPADPDCDTPAAPPPEQAPVAQFIVPPCDTEGEAGTPPTSRP